MITVHSLEDCANELHEEIVKSDNYGAATQILQHKTQNPFNWEEIIIVFGSVIS